MSINKTVAFATLGCKLNFSETSSIANQFIDAGFQRIEQNKKADVYVINTCTVTELANKKSKQIIKKLIKQNPEAKIVAVGCYTQLKPDEVADIEGVDLILGSDNKFDVLKLLNQLGKNKEPNIIINNSKNDQTFTPTYSFGDRTRSFLKVQDGCDYYCSYCAIPNARGRSRNNNIEETVKKAVEVVNKGVKEIILTGVNIGDFGKSTNESFFDLLKQLVNVKGLERLRISSIEPNLLTDEILEFAANNNVVVPHFHIPLQCGTDNLLRLMRRRYTTSLYKKRIEKIKTLMPGACIAADVIVGVPGETNEEFSNAYNFINEIDISYLHIFTYSEREDTMAVKMKNQVPNDVRKKRSKIMHDLAHKKQVEFQKSQLGTTHAVLFEGQNISNKIQGFTGNYIRVELPFDENLVNKTVLVKLIEISESGNVTGKIID